MNLTVKINIKVYFLLISSVIFHLFLVMFNKFLYQIYILMGFVSRWRVFKKLQYGWGGSKKSWTGELRIFRTGGFQFWGMRTPLHAMFLIFCKLCCYFWIFISHLESVWKHLEIIRIIKLISNKPVEDLLNMIPLTCNFLYT